MGLGCGVQIQVKHHEEIKCLKLAFHYGDNGLVKMCGVQVQVKHHEEIKCLKLAVLCGDNGLVKMCGRVAHP